MKIKADIMFNCYKYIMSTTKIKVTIKPITTKIKISIKSLNEEKVPLPVKTMITIEDIDISHAKETVPTPPSEETVPTPPIEKTIPIRPIEETVPTQSSEPTSLSEETIPTPPIGETITYLYPYIPIIEYITEEIEDYSYKNVSNSSCCIQCGLPKYPSCGCKYPTDESNPCCDNCGDQLISYCNSCDNKSLYCSCKYFSGYIYYCGYCQSYKKKSTSHTLFDSKYDSHEDELKKLVNQVLCNPVYCSSCDDKLILYCLFCENSNYYCHHIDYIFYCHNCHYSYKKSSD